MIIALGYMMSMHFFPKNIAGTILFLVFHIGIFLLQTNYFLKPYDNECLKVFDTGIFDWDIVRLKHLPIKPSEL